jgi:tetratricopeptide (TPR) repeat protein
VGGKTIQASWARDVEVDLGSALLQTARSDTDQARQRIELTEAAEHLKKAVTMGAASALLYNNLASAMSLLGDMNAAVANYRAALRLAPEDYEALMNLGAVLSRAERTDEAAENFRAAARLKPDSIEPQVYLALTLAQSGRKREAADALDVAVRRDERATNDFLTAALRMPPSEKNARDTIARLRAQ